MDEKRATWDELNLTLEVLGGQALVFHSMNLAGGIRLLEEADSVGPVLDPTGWRENHASWGPAKRVLEAAAAFVEAVRAAGREVEA